ncbi:MAG: FAD-dependent oxidoreductase [Flavobacteriales bacterium]|nr:FAD-dependent oxidoreductase [Flavobacteriales bacterium]
MRNLIKLSALLLATLIMSCSSQEKEGSQTESSVDFDVIVIGAGAAGMYTALHLDKNGMNVKVLEASSTHGGRAQFNNNFCEGFLAIGPEEVYPSRDFPIPMRTKAMTKFREIAIEEGKDPERLDIKGDKVMYEGAVFAHLPDSGTQLIDIYRDIYMWDSTLLHPFEIGEEYYFRFFDDPRTDLGDWPYPHHNNYHNIDYHMGLENIVYLKEGKPVNALEDDTYLKALKAIHAIGDYDGPDTTKSAALFAQAGIKEGDLIWTIVEDLMAAGTSASSLNHMYTSKYPEIKGEEEEEEEEREEGHYYEDPGGNVFLVDVPYKSFLDTLYFQPLHDKGLIKYDAPVVKVDYTNDVIVVTDENGETYTTNRVVSTVSSDVLKSEIIDFVPNLPADKVKAYNKMTLDVGFRMYLKFKEPIWEKDDIVEILGAGLSTRCWVPNKYRGEGVNDPNVLQCYIMGERAEDLIAKDERAEEVVVKELDAIFGGTTATDNFIEAFYMNYEMDPYIKGIYSYGSSKGWYNEEGVGADEILAKSVDNKLFFAGEATWSSTVVGAMRSGLASAEEILELDKE